MTNEPTSPPISSTPIIPLFNGFAEVSGGWRFYFGYENTGATEVTFPLGSANYFDPEPIDRGQPESFSPGTVSYAFKFYLPKSTPPEFSWFLGKTETTTGRRLDVSGEIDGAYLLPSTYNITVTLRGSYEPNQETVNQLLEEMREGRPNFPKNLTTTVYLW